jgi:hypothetical protein
MNFTHAFDLLVRITPSSKSHTKNCDVIYTEIFIAD